MKKVSRKHKHENIVVKFAKLIVLSFNNINLNAISDFMLTFSIRLNELKGILL